MKISKALINDDLKYLSQIQTQMHAATYLAQSEYLNFGSQE